MSYSTNALGKKVSPMPDQSVDLKQIGQRIREARETLGISQTELDGKTGIGLAHVSKIEAGRVDMRLSTFVRIIEALQVSADSILRADVPSVTSQYQEDLATLLNDCSPNELAGLTTVITEVKRTMRLNKPTE